MVGTSSDFNGLFLMSDTPSALSALFLKDLFDLTFCLFRCVNEKTLEQFRAKLISSKLSKG